jgi:hypothetical protein
LPVPSTWHLRWITASAWAKNRTSGSQGTGIHNPPLDRLVRDLARSDLGKFLTGGELKAYEARGKPAKKSVDAFHAVGQQGFIQGKDKVLNKGIADTLRECLPKLGTVPSSIQVEKQLDFCSLIPDISLHYLDSVLCAEFHWRNGDFLRTANRSATAQYILKKLRDYARQLGWTADRRISIRRSSLPHAKCEIQGRQRP